MPSRRCSGTGSQTAESRSAHTSSSPPSTPPRRRPSWRPGKRSRTTSSSASPCTPDPLPTSGLAVNGWVPVDQSNLRTQYPGVYAIGDVCTGTRRVPKAGIFAEAAAHVVADDIAATITGGQPPEPYRAAGICYAEFGEGHVSKVEVNFLSGEAPAAEPFAPTLAHAAEKDEFAATRRARWFGH